MKNEPTFAKTGLIKDTQNGRIYPQRSQESSFRRKRFGNDRVRSVTPWLYILGIPIGVVHLNRISWVFFETNSWEIERAVVRTERKAPAITSDQSSSSRCAPLAIRPTTPKETSQNQQRLLAMVGRLLQGLFRVMCYWSTSTRNGKWPGASQHQNSRVDEATIVVYKKAVIKDDQDQQLLQPEHQQCTLVDKWS